MSFLFRKKKHKFTISATEHTYKVIYLGNVQTAIMKGEGCTDKAAKVLFRNYRQSQASVGMQMRLTATSSGLKALTTKQVPPCDNSNPYLSPAPPSLPSIPLANSPLQNNNYLPTTQGITNYWSNRITYCLAHPDYPRLFVWVYRHETNKMKLELRCHAALASSSSKAKAIALELHDKLSFAFTEYVRDKARRQTSRLSQNITYSSRCDNTHLPVRTKFLTRGQEFKPPIQKMRSAPKLDNINEDSEEDEEEEEEDDIRLMNASYDPTYRLAGERLSEDDVIYDLEIGNDIDQLRRDEKVTHAMNDESDSNSSESGFSEVDREDTEHHTIEAT